MALANKQELCRHASLSYTLSRLCSMHVCPSLFLASCAAGLYSLEFRLHHQTGSNQTKRNLPILSSKRCDPSSPQHWPPLASFFRDHVDSQTCGKATCGASGFRLGLEAIFSLTPCSAAGALLGRESLVAARSRCTSSWGPSHR